MNYYYLYNTYTDHDTIFVFVLATFMTTYYMYIVNMV